MVPEVLLFSFERETGAREDCSVFYCEPLVVFASATDAPAIRGLIEQHIGLQNDNYDENFSRPELVNLLQAHGWFSTWSSIESYVNEELY